MISKQIEFLDLFNRQNFKRNRPSVEDSTWNPSRITGNIGPYYAFYVIDTSAYPYHILESLVDSTPTLLYDFNPGTNNYRTSPGGAWVDGTGQTIEITKIKDQSGNGVDLSFSSPYPLLILNGDAVTGSPIMRYALADDIVGAGSASLSGESAFTVAVRQKIAGEGGGVSYQEDGDILGIQPYIEEVQ